MNNQSALSTALSLIAGALREGLISQADAIKIARQSVADFAPELLADFDERATMLSKPLCSLWATVAEGGDNV